MQNATDGLLNPLEPPALAELRRWIEAESLDGAERDQVGHRPGGAELEHDVRREAVIASASVVPIR